MTENKEKMQNIDKTQSTDKCNFDMWMGNYLTISKMWEDSYTRLYRPWLESTDALFEKAVEIANTNSPEKYKEFYDIWVKTFQDKLGKFEKYQYGKNCANIRSIECNRDLLERFVTSAERSTDICKSWAKDIEENTKKTREVLKEKPDPLKYKEIYDLWIKLYAKMFDELLTLPLREDVRDMFEIYTGIPDTYSDIFVKISKLWNDSYLKLYGTWANSLVDLSKKSEEMSKGDIGPDAYKEFYDSWTNIYQQTYGKFLNVQLTNSPKDCGEQLKTTLENFVQSTTICTNLYKSWTAALSKLSQKSIELSKQTHNKDVYRETCNVWIRMYQKAFDNILNNIPAESPFKNVVIPMRDVTKLYVDVMTRMSDAFVSSSSRASAT